MASASPKAGGNSAEKPEGTPTKTPTRSTASTTDDSSVGGGVRLSVSSLHSSQDADKQDHPSAEGPATTTEAGSPAPTIEDGLAQMRLEEEQFEAATALNNPDVMQHPSFVPDGDIFESPHYGNSIFDQVTAIAPEQYQEYLNRKTVENMDPQKKYPGCTLFVANLPEKYDDVTLEAAVTKEFCRYGAMWVKMRRDWQHMPFAFVTFTNRTNMTNGLASNGTFVFERPCRVEIARANLDFLLAALDGHIISAAEAIELLREFGNISSTRSLEAGIVVSFKDFDPDRDLVAAFRDHPDYIVKPYDLHKKTILEKATKDEAFLKEYSINRCSVYVSHIHSDTEEHELHAIFEDFGHVSDVKLFKRVGKKSFAFVQFAGPDAAEAAIAANHLTLRGKIVEVERKKSKEESVTPSRHTLRRSGSKTVTDLRGMGYSQRSSRMHSGYTPARGPAVRHQQGHTPTHAGRHASMGPAMASPGHNTMASPGQNIVASPDHNVMNSPGHNMMTSPSHSMMASPDHNMMTSPGHNMMASPGGYMMASPAQNYVSPGPQMVPPPGGYPYYPPATYGHAAYTTTPHETSPVTPYIYHPASYGYGTPMVPYIPTAQGYMYAVGPSPAVVAGQAVQGAPDADAVTPTRRGTASDSNQSDAA